MPLLFVQKQEARRPRSDCASSGCRVETKSQPAGEFAADLLQIAHWRSFDAINDCSRLTLAEAELTTAGLVRAGLTAAFL